MTQRRWHADRVAGGIAEIDPQELRAEGIDGAIVDLDNTLVGYREQKLAEAEASWMVRARDAGLKVAIVSNNATSWAIDIARDLGVPAITRARKPLPGGFRRAFEVLEITRERAVVIGDQYFTDVLGAKLCGVSVILIPPLGGRDPWNTRPLRLIARLAGFERW